MGSFYKIQVINDDNEEDLGIVRLKKDKDEPTFAQIREQIEGDELVIGSFDFIEESYIIKKRQEERWTLSNKVQVRIKTSAGSIQDLPSPSKRQRLTQIGKEKGDTSSDPTSKITSKLLSASILEQWEQECVGTRLKLKQMKVSRDDRFELHSEDINGEPLVRIWCNECSSLYGKGSVEGKHAAYNCLSNFMRTHILESTRHAKNYMAFRGLRKEAIQCVGADQEQDDRKEIEASIEKLHSYMETNDGWDFEVVAATLHDFTDKSFVRVRCKYDDTWLRLCPPRSDLHTILSEHTKSISHTKAVMKEEERSKPVLTGLRGRPSKGKEHDPKQTSLSKFVVSTKIERSTKGI